MSKTVRDSRARSPSNAELRSLITPLLCSLPPPPLSPPQAIAEDVIPWLMRTDIPPPLKYPVAEIAFPFVEAIIRLFYGAGLPAKVTDG